MKKTIMDYRNDLASAEKQLEQATHRIERLEQKIKYRESLSRKERAHRLIVRGAILEQYFPELKVSVKLTAYRIPYLELILS